MIFIEHFIALFIESAPFLLLGMLIAGLIHQCVPQSMVKRILGKDASVVTASLVGAPLPLCSCSVIPVAMGIRRQGASKASTASFLVATPETGVDSIGITYALMGPVMAIARPVAAITSAIVAGVSVKFFDKETPPIDTTAVSSCCKSSCKSDTKEEKVSFNLLGAVEYGFGKLLRDFMGWLLIGLIFAALIQTFIPAETFAQYGSGVVAMTIMVVVSIPMYICATASTPIAVGLLMSGISPGAALVFMLTGPATNIATLMVVKKELGSRSLWLYLTSVIVSAVLCGLALDAIMAYMGWELSLTHGAHDDMTSLLYSASGVILALLISYQYSKKFRSWLQNRHHAISVQE
ncbi:SO_0444 family Cu/Zn efflux transporter [Aestuariibacter sp. AA17]|uniref:SO_0444 family Cu/Zn efflux transporter n=1 Tax=Fluctibacter corallii TaxID=2984329 RepID=A0ABT3A400_9ALTE|nr:SO_0444 family Cu/Zn efflux transporter [Aestuariibacter sp. AA17]MCV2883369.1 SO_0444 family Cu/Zn efflux transporter [Aestuariibacter sp. AA17]